MFRRKPESHLAQFGLAAGELGNARAAQTRIPDPISGLPEVVSSLETVNNNGVRIYKGAKLEHGDRDVWFSPATVESNKIPSKKTIFQLIYVNCSPENGVQPVKAKVYAIPEIDLKLNNIDSSTVRDFNAQLYESTEPQVLIRISSIANTMYPEMTTPASMADTETITEQLGRLEETLNIQQIDPVSRRKALHDIDAMRFTPWKGMQTIDGFTLGKPRTIRTPQGKVSVLPISAPDDPWKYYEIVVPNERAHTKQQTRRQGKSLFLRIDSGCDSGQMYGDKACDCHDQLHLALQAGATVVHIPTQDGRGYGSVTKLRTEQFKQGVDVDHQMDTVEAAKVLLGDNYDIRTYGGIGKLLASMGFTSLYVLVDNMMKIRDLNDFGFNIQQVNTNILDRLAPDHPARRHVAAKHELGQYGGNST